MWEIIVSLQQNLNNKSRLNMKEEETTKATETSNTSTDILKRE